MEDGCINIVYMTSIPQKTCYDSAVSRSHLTAEFLLQSHPVQVQIVADKLTLGQVISEYFKPWHTRCVFNHSA